MSKITPLVFQTWKSKTDIPDNFKYWSDTLRKINPTFAYRLWDDADNRAFISTNFPWFLERYDSYPAEIYRADAVRYFFLFKFGGFYADMDVEAIRPFQPLLDSDAGVILGRMGPNENFEHSIPNAVMVSKPGEEFWLFVISLLFDPPPASQQRPEYITGPVMLRTAYELYTKQYREDQVQNRLGSIRSKLTQDTSREKSEIRVLPGNFFYPLDWNDRVHANFVREPVVTVQRLTSEAVANLFPNSFVVNYWTHTWEDNNEQ